MNWKNVCVAVVWGGLLAVVVSHPTLAQTDQKIQASQQAASQARLLADVTEVFLQRCSECHGSENARPKGDFGYVMDLARLAADKELIVPGSPEKSELFIMIDEGDMPPAKSKFAPMPDAQKQVVSDWIKAGAFAISDKASGDIAGDASTSGQTPPVKPRSPLYYLVGKVHPIVIHFPIALIIAAGLAELFSLTQRRTGMTSAVTFCLLLGSAGAVVAAISGWVFAMDNGYPIELNTEYYSLHRWLGVACALLSPLLLWIDLLSVKDRRFFRVFLLLVVILVMATGHFGGMLVYGEALFSL